jgi:GNAT superfamily N-acetyltransferase
MHFELRPATPSDREWLFALDCATMGAAGGPDPTGVEARRASFDRHFDPALISVIRAGGRDAGALRLEERGDALYLAVLEVAPDLQGRGLGTAVLRHVLARAAAERRPVICACTGRTSGPATCTSASGSASPPELTRSTSSGTTRHPRQLANQVLGLPAADGLHACF